MVEPESEVHGGVWPRRVAWMVVVTTLVGSLVASPDRFLLVLPAAAALVLTLRLGPAWVLPALPWLLLANLEPIRQGRSVSDGLYPSEAILLAAMCGALWNGRLRLAARDWPALAFGGWIILAALPAMFTGEVEVLWRPLRLGCVAWGAYTIGRATGEYASRRLWQSVAIWILSMAVVSVIEISMGSRRGAVPQIGALVGGSELLAVHLTLFWPLVVAAALGSGGRPGWLWWSSTLLGGVTLVLTFSRSGWIGGWAALLTVSALLAWRSRRLVARLALGGALATTGVMAMALVSGTLPGFVPESYADRLLSLGAPEVFADRAEPWGRGLEAIRTSPVWGDPEAPNAYNLILGLASRSGLPVLLPFLWLVWSAFRGSWCPRGGRASVVGAGIAGAVVGLLVTGIGESSLGSRMMPCAMAVLGLGASGFAADDQPEDERGSD